MKKPSLNKASTTKIDSVGVSDRDSLYRAKTATTLRTVRERAALSLRELARRAGTSHATLSAYENGRKSPSMVTFLRIIDACSQSIDFELAPRIREFDGIERGEELEQALILAGEFPARHSPDIEFPPFKRAG